MIVRLGDSDNVGIATENINSSYRDSKLNIIPNESIRSGHKIALNDIHKGQYIIKFNQIIGVSSKNISRGDYVHLHNIASIQTKDLKSTSVDYEKLLSLKDLNRSERTFDGYLRSDGKVGTRNYIGIISTVNCVSTVVKKIANSFEDTDIYKNVDGVVPLTHSLGCGHVVGKDDIDVLIRVIVGYISHPNFDSLLIIGLGCEDNQTSTILERLPELYKDKVKYLMVQENGGTENTVAQGEKLVINMLEQADSKYRTPQSASHLSLALQCGGSDAFSAITSNPVLGYASDQTVVLGGTSILSETPEIYGSEQLLFSRMRQVSVINKLKKKLDWWKNYLSFFSTTFDSQPAPGNKAGGISTVQEKSLGSVSKSGYSEIKDVINYAMPITKNGMVMMDSPGYDPVAVTGQIASGANIVCFTTGRGSTIGFKPSPCIKIASNTDIYNALKKDMDFNCGDVINGSSTISELGKQLFEFILDTASGRKTCSEQQNYGDNEFNPWHLGPTV